jgi:hypothetical protein
VIPAFDAGGNLPPGIHPASWDEIVTRYAADTRRRELLDGLLDAYARSSTPAVEPCTSTAAS